MTVTGASSEIFTPSAIFGSGGVFVVGIIAYICSKLLLRKNASWQDRATFIWLAFDASIHFVYEGSFLYMSVFGRQVATSTGPLAEMSLSNKVINILHFAGMDYAKADYRWAIADPTVVSLEILTVLGAAPICCYILRQIVKDDPARHYWLVIVSTAELYGGFMTFCPEWLTGNPNLSGSNWFHFWFYLMFMNLIWVVIPVWLMFDSYGHIASSLRAKKTESKAKSN